MSLDITKNRDLIPSKFFDPKGECEEDKNSVVLKKEFGNRKEVPLDYAFCRWLCMEKGVTLMPVSSFCLDESESRLENFARFAICKDDATFRDESLIELFKSL